MKHRYMITKNEQDAVMVIKEFCELDKELFSLVCEETYDAKKIKSAIRQGLKSLIRELRTHNLYPIETCALDIAAAVKKLYKSSDNDSVEVLFEDMKNDVQEEAEEAIPVDIVDDDDDDESDKSDNIIEDGTDLAS